VEGDGFDEFVRSNSTSLFRTALALTREVGAAEDILQDTWIRIFGHWERVRALDAPLAYVRRALVNRFLASRRGLRHRVTIVPYLDDAIDADRSGDVLDRMVLIEMLSRLPARQQVAIVLRFYEGLSDDDIAIALRCSSSTVRSLIHRGIRALQRRLTGQRFAREGIGR